MPSAPPEKIERLLRQRESLRAVIESISSELALRPLLTRIVRHACTLLEARDGSIGLYDERRNVIRTAAIYRMPASELGAEMGPGVGLAGQVLLARKPVVLKHYGQVPRPTLKRMLGNPVIGMPIFWRKKLIGFFGIGSRAPHQFERRHVETLALLARHAAIAIENARRYEFEQRRTERMALIARIGRMITADLQIDDLLQNAADAIHELLGYAHVSIPLLDPAEPGTLLIRAIGGKYKRQLRGEHRFAVSAGLMGAAVRTRQPQRANDVQNETRYIRIPGVKKSAINIQAELALPILLGGTVLGVLNVESEAPITDEEATSLQIIADHLAVAINNARLFARSQQAAVLEERQRLARDLHDSVTQLLFSTTLIAQSISPAWKRAPAEGEQRVKRLLDISGRALTEMRALITALRPTEPEFPPGGNAHKKARRIGLAHALKRHIQGIGADGPLIELEVRNYRPLPPAMEKNLLGIAQEALNNVVKHSRAKHVKIVLAMTRNQLSLRVTDDGVGIKPRRRSARPVAGGGVGLNSMKERALALRGNLTVRARPGRGTVVQFVARLKDPSA